MSRNKKTFLDFLGGPTPEKIIFYFIDNNIHSVNLWDYAKQKTERKQMSKIRMNTEFRNKILNRYVEHAETETKMESGLTFQQVMLLNALRRQAKTGMLMTNPRVTGYTSFAKAVLAFIDDKKAPKTCKNLYEYLVKKGYYDNLEMELA